MSHHYIEFKNVSYRYASGTVALRDVSFRISHGEKVALLGRNGAGKSTLLQLTDGLLLPSEGTVDVGGIPVTKQTLPQIRQTVGMVFQNPDDQLFMPTVEEDVAFGPINMRLPEEEVRRRVDMALQAVGCSDLATRSPLQLSGGQKRRVAIATVLSMQPSILVLDEPTSNLDWEARDSVERMIGGFMHTCLVASHDLALVRRICRRAIVIDKGEIKADCPVSDVFENEDVMRLLGLSKASLSEMCVCGG
ncbi:MAG: ABC transporter ATP-binding protein [Muribaculaceae bacterium]|nr:ABC transporter ATP-binding protein [Muribaculaceae bacterium]